MKYLWFKFLIVVVAIFVANISFAATMGVNVSQETLTVGNEFDADIKIDSGDAGINATQATIKFSPAVLEVVEVIKTGSAFNFWLEEPTFSNEKGEVSFVGGSTSGLIGKSLQALRIVFKVKGIGTSDIAFSDGAITASDGSGTNVLSAMNKASIQSVEIGSATTTKVQQVQRTPILASQNPAKPVVKVSLYPDPTKWYSLSSKFSANWVLPADISDVATTLNKNPTYEPNKSEGIFDNESFPALDDGIWYLHVRFYNNIGWSPTNHYRIAIDTTPPSSFDIKFSEPFASDNPTPTVSYQINDQLSGIDTYYIKIDNNETINTDKKTYVLLKQKPGKHTIKIGAQDRAGNKVESTAEFEILPIISPKIVSLTTNLFSGEGGLVISGTSITKALINIDIKDSKGNVVYSLKTNADDAGTWAMNIDSPLKNGTYYIEVVAEDSRGASSFPVKSSNIKVSTKPILVIFGFNFTAVHIIIIIIIIFIAGWYSSHLVSAQRNRKILISQRDVSASFNIIRGNVSKAMKSWSDGKVDEREISEIEFLLKETNNSLDKLEEYIIKGIKDIGRKKYK